MARREARRRSGVPRIRCLDRGRARIEAELERAEALSAAHEYEDAIAAYREVAPAADESGSAALQARALAGRGLGAGAGQVRDAMELLVRARELVERPEFSDVDRADVLFRLGVCRYKLSSISTAVALFDEALQLAERSGFPCGLLLSDILQWRSRCRRRLRDYVAARDDVQRALELAEDAGDRAAIARVLPGLAHRPARGPTSSPQLRPAGEGLYQAVNDERKSDACT